MNCTTLATKFANPYFRPISALLLCALANTPCPAQISSPPSGSMGRAHATVPGIEKISASFHFLKDEPYSLVGWTYDWDSDAGEFVAKKPIFSVVLDADTNAPDFHVDFTSVFGSSSINMTNQTSFEVSTSTWLVKLAASFAQSSQAYNGTLSSSMRLSVVADYPPSLVDLVTLPSSAFTQEALDVLSIADPVQRSTEWTAHGFGSYVAVGCGLTGSVLAQFSLSQLESFSARLEYFKFAGSYAGISASANIGEAVYKAMSSTSIGVSMDTVGLGTPPPLPPLDQLDSPQEQFAWGNSLTQYAADAKAKRGIFIVPVSVLPNGPDPDLAVWSTALLEHAALEAQSALATWNNSCFWNAPAGLQYFLATRMIPDGSMSYSTALLLARSDLALALEQLHSSVLTYTKDNNSAVPAFQAAVASATQLVHDRVIDLQEVLALLDAMRQSLPSITIKATDPGYTPPGVNNGYTRVPWIVEVENVAWFDGGGVQQLVNWLHECDGDPDPGATFTVYGRSVASCALPKARIWRSSVAVWRKPHHAW